MGTTESRKIPGEKLIDHVIRTEFSWSDCAIIDTSSKGNEHYLAVKIKKENAELTIGFVALTYKRGNSIGVKVLEESEGPYYYRAPKRLIKKLSAPINEYARQWREKCLNN